MKFTKKDKRKPIDKEIDHIVDEMSGVLPESDEYKKMADNLEVLMKARSYEKGQTKVSADTKWLIIGNIVGIVIIVGFEQAHIVTSKALGFVIKGRV